MKSDIHGFSKAGVLLLTFLSAYDDRRLGEFDSYSDGPFCPFDFEFRLSFMHNATFRLREVPHVTIRCPLRDREG